MRLSALTVLNFNSNINYLEIRRKIQKEPIGPYDTYHLVDVPEDVFIMHIDTESTPSYSQDETVPTQINTGTVTQKLSAANGKLGYLWNKINQKCPNATKATKAFLAYLGIDQLLDIGHTLHDKTGEISHTINDKIGGVFDDLNNKIKDFSFKKLDDLAGEIVDKHQDVSPGETDTTHTIGEAATDLSDNSRMETEGYDTSDEIHSNDDIADNDSDIDINDISADEITLDV